MLPRVTAATKPTSVRGGEIIVCEPTNSALSIALLALAAISTMTLLGSKPLPGIPVGIFN
jgi:hypothetical protein